MADDPAPPSRRRRLLARGKLALTLIAPVIALVAFYFIARQSGAADQDNVTQLATPTPPFVTLAAATRTPEPRFQNPLFGGGTLRQPCPSPTPHGSLQEPPTPKPGQCDVHIEMSFTNHWLN